MSDFDVELPVTYAKGQKRGRNSGVQKAYLENLIGLNSRSY
jgi:hypothetical protein